MATIKVSSFAELEKILKQKLTQAMSQDKLGKDIKEEVQKHIRDDVYATYTPDAYNRTGEFEKSVVSTSPSVSGDGVEISIEHDPNLMNMREPWYHQSVINGKDIREALPEIIHDGLTHDLWGHGDRAYLKPRPYMDNTVKELESSKKHVKQLARHLRSLGLNVKE